MTNPQGTARLFGPVAVGGPDAAAEDTPERLLGEEGRSHLCARLLEDGDRVDLRWLFGTLGRDTVSAWFAAQGGRLLAPRSRAFWSLVLERESPPAHPIAAAIWPH